MNQPPAPIYSVFLENFGEKVLGASQQRPILADLWAEWECCPSCIVIAPVVEQVIRDANGEIALAKLEVDEGENMKIAGRYHSRRFD